MEASARGRSKEAEEGRRRPSDATTTSSSTMESPVRRIIQNLLSLSLLMFIVCGTLKNGMETLTQGNMGNYATWGEGVGRLNQAVLISLPPPKTCIALLPPLSSRRQEK